MCDAKIVPTRESYSSLSNIGTFLPLGFTALCLGLLLILKSEDINRQLLTAFLLFWIFYAAYIFAGIKTSILPHICAAALVYLELTTSFATPFFYIFRVLLPGTASPNSSFLHALTAAFFGSGLMEELMKAVPALVGLYIAVRPREPGARTPRYLDYFRCSTPLQGVLLGLAGGACFVYVETLYQMTPVNGIYVANPEHYYGSVMLLLERTRQGIFGNMTRAGIAGFFIGLAARHPRHMVILLAIGWLLPAVLHAFWNVSPYLGDAGRWMKNGLSVLIFLACFIRAKQLHARSQL